MPTQSVNIFWYRRDLRLNDNAALFHALKEGHPVVPVFIFDQDILDHLEDKQDRRVVFIHRALLAIQEKLEKLGSSLDVRYGKPLDVFRSLSETYTIANVFTNHDYEPYAVARDKEVGDLINSLGAVFHTYKDQVIFEKTEIMKDDGTPYTVFTPYSKKWKAAFEQKAMPRYDVNKYDSTVVDDVEPPWDRTV